MSHSTTAQMNLISFDERLKLSLIAKHYVYINQHQSNFIEDTILIHCTENLIKCNDRYKGYT